MSRSHWVASKTICSSFLWCKIGRSYQWHSLHVRGFELKRAAHDVISGKLRCGTMIQDLPKGLLFASPVRAGVPPRHTDPFISSAAGEYRIGAA